MCGIVGFIGEDSAVEPVLAGLKSLEYRGYDSAGITALGASGPVTTKQVGRVEALEAKIQAERPRAAKFSAAIGHTRWATHGAPTVLNAHPHHNADQTIFVVHNGIIENYQELKTKLKRAGYKFVSQTDTEVIPHLIDHHLKRRGDFFKALESALKELRGAYALAVLNTDEADKLYAARLSSPLVIGVGKDNHIVASDPSAILEHTKRVLFLDDYEIATITKSRLDIHNVKQAMAVTRQAEELDYDVQRAQLDDYAHFMLKEIHEAPETIRMACRGRLKPELNTVKLGGLEAVEQQLRYIDRMVIVACGTSYYAGLIGEYLIEEIAGIPVEVQLASEFKYRSEPFSRSTALLAVSQSGETADTIAALKKVEDYGVLRLGIVNAVGSTIARLTDAGVYCHAGPEQSVASTKAFIAQVAVLAEIALYLSQGRSPFYKPLMNELAALPDKVTELLERGDAIRKIARRFSAYDNFLFIGRGYAYPCALEGALKLKEISYIHAEGYAAGEMKHGPLAMIDKRFPTVALAAASSQLDKTYSNIEEIKTRGGPVLALATDGDKLIRKLTDDVIYLPTTIEQLLPLIMVTALQLFAYFVAVSRGHNVDRPRNLAKSVTVE